MRSDEPIALFTCRDAARITQCSHTTILRWAKSGRLPIHAKTPSGILLFAVADLIRLTPQARAEAA